MEKFVSPLPSVSSSELLPDATLAAPPRKLEAEDFHAEDQDGVTQSLFGSGNLNYLTLQARQTDALLSGSGIGAATGKGEMDMLAGGYAAGSAHRFLEGAASAGHGGIGAPDSSSGSSSATGGMDGSAARMAMNGDAANARAAFGTQGFASAAPAVSFEAAGGSGSGDRLIQSGRNGTGGHDGHDGATGATGATGGTGASGSNGSSGTDGTNGIDGTHGGNGHDGISVVITLPGGGDGGTGGGIGDTVTQIINNAGDTINNITHTLTDTVTNITQTLPGTVTQVVHDLPDIVNNVTNTVSNVYDTVTHVTGDLGGIVSQVADPVQALVSDLPSTVDHVTTPIADIVAALPDTLGNLTGGALDLPPVVDTLTQSIADTVASVPDTLDSLIDPLTHGQLPDLGDTLGQVADTAGGLVEGLLGDGGASGGILQPVADAVADLPATLDNLTGGALDLPPVVDTLTQSVADTVASVSDTLGGIVDPLADGQLPDIGGTLGQVADTAGGLVEGLLGGGGAPGGDDIDLSLINDLGLPQVAVNLDPVESLVGDIDLGIGITHDADSLGAGIDLTALGLQVPEINLDTGSLLGGAPAGGDTDLSLANDLGLPQVAVNLDPVESLVGDIDLGIGITHDANSAGVGIDLTALGLQVPEINLDTGSLLGSAPAGDDTDLLAMNDLGLPEIAVNLDPVEGIVGDIDLTLGVSHDQDGIIVDLNALALGTQLPEVTLDTGAPAAGGDTDLSVANDLGLPQIGVNLDPVESIVGDIDVGVGMTHDADSLSIDLNVLALGDQLPATDITVSTSAVSDVVNTVTDTLSGIADQAAGVQSVADSAIDLLTAGASSTPVTGVTDAVSTVVDTASSWTETAATDTASTIGGLVDTVTSGLGAVLPEPTGAVSSGLSLLTGLTDTHSSSGHGLLGGHHGGLF